MRWTLVFLGLAAVAALIAWAALAGRAELEREKATERPVEAPERLSRAADGTVRVRLDLAAQERIGLKVAALGPREAPRERKAYGKVLDPGSLLTLHGELTTAEAALTASRAEHERVKTLHQEAGNVSKRSREAAEAQFLSDQSRAQAAARRIQVTWGAAVAALSPVDREALVDRMARGTTVFARASLPAGESADARPLSATVLALGREERLRADQVLEAPEVDVKLQGQGFLLRFDGAGHLLRPGVAVTAFLELPGEPERGVVIPRSAVVRLEGRGWVYVQEGPTDFVRRQLELHRLSEEGWFAAGGFAAGEQVVVVGAQAILSEELRSRIHLGEDEE
jgi:hypothetical protein